MKVLVIGCGSIGQRHIRNLVSEGIREIFAFDVDKKKLKEVKKIASSIITAQKLSLLCGNNPEIAFITLPTSLHTKYAIEAAEKKCHLFIEKPLSNNCTNVKALIDITKREKLVTLVGCNMRFYWAIDKIKRLLKKNLVGKINSARIECGQYLPDWRPGVDYKNTYSAKRKSGGGVILDAIHEIDYASWFFGEVSEIVAMFGKLSSLEIETEDVAEVIVKFKKGPLVNIHIDYLQRVYGRSCKIIGEKGTIMWDFNDHVIRVYLVQSKKWRMYPEPGGYDINQMYVDELKYFLMCVKKKQPTFNDIVTGKKTLQIALEIKEKGVNIS